MASKKKNKAKNPPKTRITTSYWLQLPQQILQLFPQTGKPHPLHYTIAFTGVTKTRVPTSTRCGRSERPPHLRRVEDTAYLKYFPRDCPFTADRSENIEARMAFQRQNPNLWAYDKFRLADPFNYRRDHLLQRDTDFTSGVNVGGKGYHLSMEGDLFVVEMIGSRQTITGAAWNRAVPSSRRWRFFKEHMVEMGGEIFLILFVHERSLRVLDGIEVYRLCLSGLKWIGGERIGGKVLFLDPKFCWLNSSEIGCDGDCIYFTQPTYSGWLVFDMKSGRISYV